MNNSPQLDTIFFPNHSDCIAPITVIVDILAENDPLKFEQISSEFDLLGFTKVKDLAKATLEKASSIKLHGDSLTLLYKAIEVYNKRLDYLLQLAKLESRNGNFVKTQEICMTLLMQKPGNLDAILLIADSFFNCELYDLCIDYLKVARKIDTKSIEVNMNLGLAYWKTSQNREAKFYISTACLLKPERIDNWITYADFLFQINDYALAKVLYEFILRKNNYTNLFKVHNNYGKLLFCTNNIKEAEQQFKIALHISPEFQESLNNLANLYFMINEFDNAILFYQKSLEINPDDKIRILNLGMAYLKATKYQKAVETFEKAIKLDPENFSALQLLAITYYYQEDMVSSVETLKKCLDFQPKNFNINLELALINFQHLDNFQDAEIYFKKCIELNPERKDLYKYLYSVYIKLKKYVDASDIYISLGDLYMKDNDQENAQNAYYAAIHVNPRNALGHWKVGVTYYNQGHLDLALIRYKNAIFLKPTFSNPYRDCAIIFEEKGNIKMAKEYYQAAIQQKSLNCNSETMLEDLQHKICQLEESIKALEIDNETVEINEQIE